MKEGGFVCVKQVGRGWLCELVPIFDDRMVKVGGWGKWDVSRGERSRILRHRNICRAKRDENGAKCEQVCVMKEDNKSLLSGHVGQDVE